MSEFQFPFEPDPYVTVDGLMARASGTEWIQSDTVMEVRR